MRQIIYSSVKMGLFRQLMNKAKDRRGGKNPALWEKSCYAIFSGGLGAWLSNPTDLAMVRFQSDGLLPVEKRRNYKNFFDAASRMAKEEGIPAMWKGSIANVGRSAALTAGQLATNSQITEMLQEKWGFDPYSI